MHSIYYQTDLNDIQPVWWLAKGVMKSGWTFCTRVVRENLLIGDTSHFLSRLLSYIRIFSRHKHSLPTNNCMAMRNNGGRDGLRQ